MRASIGRWWRSLSTRSKALVVGVALVLVAIAAATNPTPGPTAPDTPPSPPILSSRAAPSTAAGPTEPGLTAPSIPGLTAADLKLNLEERDFTCVGPTDDNEGGIYYECTSGEEYRVLWRGRSPTDVFYVDSTALLVSEDDAATFLGYIASVPCEGCQQADAKAWAEANTATGGETTIGPIYYLLYPSGSGAWVLEMSAAE